MDNTKRFCQQIVWDYIHGASTLRGTSIATGLPSSVTDPSKMDIDAWLDHYKKVGFDTEEDR